jgi:tetratricopeptide (TPR) repeat protein
MSGWKPFLMVAAALSATPAFAQPAPNLFSQIPQVSEVPQIPQIPFAPQDLDTIMAHANAGLARAEGGLARAERALAQSETSLSTWPDLAGLPSKMSALFNQSGMLFQTKGRTGKFDADYDNGARALDDHKYDEAVGRFDAVIDSKSPRADGALFWKAYALNRLGRRDDALAALAVLRRDYPGSHWLNDAQALEAEVKQGSGQAVSPAQETNEDLKLMAINSLMAADPDRALPLLESLLKGNSSPKVKDRALFVLTQNRSPQAQQILLQYAKGAGNPDLQVRAIRYIGMSGTDDARQQLADIYGGSNDTSVKRQIIQSLMVSNGRDTLFTLARNEKDEELRAEAIRQLGVIRANIQLGQLYGSETSADVKVQIIRSLFVAGDSDRLVALAKNEKDSRILGEAIRNLVMLRSTSAETVVTLYTSVADPKAKKAVIDGLFARGDARPLIDLARKETDPAIKKYAVERLTLMHSKEATDYMMELLK